MKKFCFLLSFLLFFISCEKQSDYDNSSNDSNTTNNSNNGSNSVPGEAYWIIGTWTGNITVKVDGMSTNQYATLTFDEDGLVDGNLEEYFGDLDIKTTYSASSCKLTFDDNVSIGGVSAKVSGSYTLTKTGSNTCSLSGSVKATVKGYSSKSSVSGNLKKS